jgi:hypothetical protein
MTLRVGSSPIACPCPMTSLFEVLHRKVTYTYDP